MDCPMFSYDFPSLLGFPASHLWPGGLLLDIIQLFDLILVAHSQHWPCEEVIVDLQRRNMVQRSQLTASIYIYNLYIYIFVCVRLCIPYRNLYGGLYMCMLYVYIYIHMYTYTNIQYTCVHWIHETYTYHCIAVPSYMVCSHKSPQIIKLQHKNKWWNHKLKENLNNY